MKMTLMIQGTTSDAGKSTLATALCRVLSRRGKSVAPFKPQNMALNSAVTVNGGEIGRAQAVQAQACGVEPHTDMNPVLLKPSTNSAAQVIINGRPLADMNATSFHDYKTTAMSVVLAAYHRLQNQYDYIIVEGAGSPAEINLRDRDIANMGFAEAIDCPVILIADIDRGGVFAHIIGTLSLLSNNERNRVIGFVINRFRGDLSLLEDGLRWLEAETEKPVLGVLPYLHDLHLEAEDSINDTTFPAQTDTHESSLRIVVPALPHISSHTDFDPLRLHPQVNLQFVGPNDPIPQSDVIILPGSKSVRSDLTWLRKYGWQQRIDKHLRYGGKLIGICGGFQMLGHHIHDPHGVEGDPGSLHGFAILDMETHFEWAPEKILEQRIGSLTFDNSPVSGYEVHMGRSTGAALSHPFIISDQGQDGAISKDNQVIGSYWHGLFESPDATNAILSWAGLKEPQPFDYHYLREQNIERLADSLEQHLDLSTLPGFATTPPPSKELAQ